MFCLSTVDRHDRHPVVWPRLLVDWIGALSGRSAKDAYEHFNFRRRYRSRRSVLPPPFPPGHYDPGTPTPTPFQTSDVSAWGPLVGGNWHGGKILVGDGGGWGWGGGGTVRTELFSTPNRNKFVSRKFRERTPTSQERRGETHFA